MKLLFTIGGLLLTHYLFSQVGSGASNGQGVTQWKTNGNIVDTNQFIGTKNQKPLILKTDNTERFRISQDGYIGIGTSSPQTKLDVYGNVTLRNEVYLPGLYSQNNLNSILFYDDQTGALRKGSVGSLGNYIYEPKPCTAGYQANPVWWNGLNKIFVECPDVHVGIGTNAPDYELHVIGTGKFNLVKLGLEHYAGATVASFIEGYWHENSGRPWINFAVQQTNPNDPDKSVFVVENDGGLYCTSVRIRFRDDIPVPDYVFGKNYDLMSLSETEKYIQENGHLPNMPAENEFRAEGLSVEEMQFKLLEKIEELTLHLIEQQEQIESQQLEIDSLKDDLNR